MDSIKQENKDSGIYFCLCILIFVLLQSATPKGSTRTPLRPKYVELQDLQKMVNRTELGL